MQKKTFLLGILLLVACFLLFLPCESDLYCTGPYARIVQYPFIWFLVFIPLSILAIKLNNHKYKFWLKFSVIFFIISMVIVSKTPEYGAGIIDIDRELTNWFFAGLYVFISVIYFIVQFIKKRKMMQNNY